MTDKQLSEKLNKIAKEIEGLTVIEMAELSEYLEKKFGVSAMPVAAPAAAVSNGANAAKEEKTSFTVVLSNCGANKLAVIKAVREILPNLGLMEAKKMVESAPQELLKEVKKNVAEEAKKKLETAGGKVELK
ncbi:50S ribosomal protein L7/L12 [Candidatus Roizmanbacteria bacterium CG02_land_8_20_14_3_00_36_15]|uniref:Large ribosomal subunit protein bL12 n=2 Tax=Candidatus Roizmaniibacteriota TaxID=1752723 RepID=A0A2M8KKU0_9BACT|nr:MAG: 50S ribosomal protein L7/L12 [Candidatus Roizmanbacteria bacterium CG03_land_8_20_14_0_80_36_21]PIV37818.1 MAG: 50S ribosomal protein L7/L12 [Candidatus Roizmanbacteria bacterium CG02_land_8_20_14_3_00_36_15]PIY70366.1 MAG: 50S ribosomal protein L7/L12 [Candidatus Roizmanbacteria bacterium CG_4_10_14_0_8_um_filter_36_36]PJA52845.1 MAG: 50S ribosomal protein L7/L12 [Candidatus Roizmanbacteria bacterium CG_4_9_14_3_um_filter_36_11]PJC81271.1 MAG: 50S ribosomal protein L7/L12 [Candidatus R